MCILSMKSGINHLEVGMSIFLTLVVVFTLDRFGNERIKSANERVSFAQRDDLTQLYFDYDW